MAVVKLPRAMVDSPPLTWRVGDDFRYATGSDHKLCHGGLTMRIYRVVKITKKYIYAQPWKTRKRLA